MHSQRRSDFRRWTQSGCEILLIGSLFLFAGPFWASAFTALVAFGDSYTDTGNLPSSPPNYWNGRFSNGPLWVEDLSQTLGFAYNPANNFAVSGTESDELGIAISRFPGTGDSQNVLFAIWTANNDFVNHLSIGFNDGAWDTRINNIVSGLMTAGDLLYQKGARRLVLFNLIDVMRCPQILSGYSATFRGYMEGKIQIFNSRLAAAVPNLLSSHPGLQVYLLDTYSNFNYLLDHYPAFGFTRATVGALNDPSLTDNSFSGPGANYVFWDSQHPTAKTHALIAGWVQLLLPPPPPPTIVISSPQNGAQFAEPATIAVSATVVPNGWNVAQVAFSENNAVVGQVSTPPYNFSFPAAAAGTYTLSAQVSYGQGLTATADPIQVTVTPPPGASPPAPWNSQDIGAVGQPGTAYYALDGTFTVIGSGADIWGTADAFQYVYQPFVGSGSIVAAVSGLQSTDGYAKAGVMFRETLDPGARNAIVFITPSSVAGFQTRVLTNSSSAYVPGPAITPPYWLKLERRGDAFNGYGSSDGTNWMLLGSATNAMSTNAYVGLAVSSHNNALLSTAQFTNVLMAHPVVPVQAALQITRSVGGTIQVSLTGSIGSTYVWQMSTNLLAWVPISTNVNALGTLQFQPSAVGLGLRSLYRAVLLPSTASGF